MKARSPNMTPEMIAKAVRLLNSWTDELSWTRFIAVLQTEIGFSYTKAGLSKHEEIKKAWDLAYVRSKQKTSGEGGIKLGNDDEAFNYMQTRLDEALIEIKRLKAKEDWYKAKFKRWAYNAAQEGFTEEQLDRSYRNTGG
ncbi:hypothetical protein [Pseudoalteromonas sp. T1lg24]|uniref:hypothetical protein n=1 Tax=Pseudoalteromonas sp. T1lg24 TaxID=2077099 RepID=UPI000CF6EBD5|nr:hypothetical protein [Pseudoalteromonas sp. T1lg24]